MSRRFAPTRSAKEKEDLQPLLAARAADTEAEAKPRLVVKKWTLDELAPIVEKGTPCA
jgi:hypothetical protein